MVRETGSEIPQKEMRDRGFFGAFALYRLSFGELSFIRDIFVKKNFSYLYTPPFGLTARLNLVILRRFYEQERSAVERKKRIRKRNFI